jgi:hypothetical protein
VEDADSDDNLLASEAESDDFLTSESETESEEEAEEKEKKLLKRKNSKAKKVGSQEDEKKSKVKAESKSKEDSEYTDSSDEETESHKKKQAKAPAKEAKEKAKAAKNPTNSEHTAIESEDKLEHKSNTADSDGKALLSDISGVSLISESLLNEFESDGGGRSPVSIDPAPLKTSPSWLSFKDKSLKEKQSAIIAQPSPSGSSSSPSSSSSSSTKFRKKSPGGAGPGGVAPALARRRSRTAKDSKSSKRKRASRRFSTTSSKTTGEMSWRTKLAHESAVDEVRHVAPHLRSAAMAAALVVDAGAGAKNGIINKKGAVWNSKGALKGDVDKYGNIRVSHMKDNRIMRASAMKLTDDDCKMKHDQDSEMTANIAAMIGDNEKILIQLNGISVLQFPGKDKETKSDGKCSLVLTSSDMASDMAVGEADLEAGDLTEKHHRIYIYHYSQTKRLQVLEYP